MSAKSIMAAMTLLSLLGFSDVLANPEPPSATGGVRTDYSHPSDAVTVFANIYKQYTSLLSGADRETHTKTVIFAAAALDNGQTAEWSNPENKTGARIRVVLTKPVQGGYCRLLYTEVVKDDQVKEYKEYACKTIDNQFWTFHYAKY